MWFHSNSIVDSYTRESPAKKPASLGVARRISLCCRGCSVRRHATLLCRAKIGWSERLGRCPNLASPVYSRCYLLWIEGDCSASSFANATVPLASDGAQFLFSEWPPRLRHHSCHRSGYVRNIDVFLLPLGSSGGSFVSVRRLRNGDDPRRSSRVA